MRRCFRKGSGKDSLPSSRFVRVSCSASWVSISRLPFSRRSEIRPVCCQYLVCFLSGPCSARTWPGGLARSGKGRCRMPLSFLLPFPGPLVPSWAATTLRSLHTSLRSSGFHRGTDLPPRVRAVVDRAHLIHVELGVDLGGGDTRVAQKLLHHAEIGSAPDQMHRVSVAKGVGAHSLRDACMAAVLFQNSVRGLTTQGGPSIAQEQRGYGTPHESRTHLGEILFNPRNRVARDRHDPGFAALSGHPEGGLLKVNFLHSEAHRFADSEASTVNHLHQGPIAQALERGLIRRGKKALQHLGSERFGEPLGESDAARRRQVSARPQALLLQELEERPESTDSASRGRGGHSGSREHLEVQNVLGVQL